MQIKRLLDDQEVDFFKISKVTTRALPNYGTVQSSKLHLVKKVPC